MESEGVPEMRFGDRAPMLASAVGIPATGALKQAVSASKQTVRHHLNKVIDASRAWWQDFGKLPMLPESRGM